VYEVAVFAVDTAIVGGLTLRRVNSDGDTTVAVAPLGMLPVHSVVPDSARGIYDLAPLAQFPRNWWLWVLAGLAVVGLLVLAGYYFAQWRRRRPEEKPARAETRANPYRDALDRLQRLSAAPAPDSARAVKEYYVELSDIVRTYLELRVQIPALEQTTPELAATLERLTGVSSDVISEEAAQQILDTLLIADLAKFAKHIPADSENKAALSHARESIDAIERSRLHREELEAARAREA
jgi:hypothetical protein